MAGNSIYRGPIAREPQTLNLPTAGAYKPGILVTEDGSKLTVATASDARAKLWVLGNQRFKDQDAETAYTSGDTGIAYEALVGEVYQVRLAAATYAKGDALTVGASGYLGKAGTSAIVHAYFDDAAGAFSAGDLADVRIADRLTTAAA